MTIIIKTKNKKEEKNLIAYFESLEVEYVITKEGELDTQKKNSKSENAFVNKWRGVLKGTTFTENELQSNLKLQRIYMKHISKK